MWWEACLCGIFYKLSKLKNIYTKERRKLIIKSQIYNDSNCNNNKHSRWAQCNSFPLLVFPFSRSHSLSFILLTRSGFQFPSISYFLSFQPSLSLHFTQAFVYIFLFFFFTFHMTINFLVVLHISLVRYLYLYR